MDPNDILYVLENRCLFLKLVGEIRHTHCIEFDSLIQNVIQQDLADEFVVDLRQATFLDSTSLGIIARLARHTQKKSLDKPILISTNEDVDQILSSVQFNEITQIVEKRDNLPAQYFNICEQKENVRSPGEIVLDSHKELTKTNKKNLDKFVNVIESLEKKYKRKKKSNSFKLS